VCESDEASKRVVPAIGRAEGESRVEDGHLMPDHINMLLKIPSKYAVSQMVGYIKGKSLRYPHVFHEGASI